MALAVGLSGLLRDVVFGISPTDPAVFVTVPVLLPMAVLAACLVPALKAVRTDPARLLRST